MGDHALFAGVRIRQISADQNPLVYTEWATRDSGAPGEILSIYGCNAYD
jgi:hypothetical protein